MAKMGSAVGWLRLLLVRHPKPTPNRLGIPVAPFAGHCPSGRVQALAGASDGPGKIRAAIADRVPGAVRSFDTEICFVTASVGDHEMRYFSVWLAEFLKLVAQRRRHPVTTLCPICQQTVRLHVNRAGRQHMYSHARSLFEGARFGVHYSAEAKCVGSGKPAMFDPRPGEPQRFKLPEGLREK
jgi:hypothetical protein